MMKRVTYVSRFTESLGRDALDDLARAAAEKNRRLGITGFLMTSGGLFYQLLEGPPEAVDELLDTISADPRHTDLLILSSSENVSDRLFPDWAMEVMDLDAAAHVRLMPLKALIKAAFEQRRILDMMVWSVERTLQHEMARQRSTT